MAETKPTASAAVKSPSSAQPKKSSNTISWLAPLSCIILGYIIWRFALGAPSNFTQPDLNGGFWPQHKGPKAGISKMYEGGIIVPILIGCFLTVLTFCIERLLTVSKAAGSGNIAEFVRTVQFHLANKDVDKALVALRQTKRICR